jgi:PhzF family phenazine biosynthesis protein
VSIPIFQVDAFTNRRFAGNPAAVMVMEAFPADSILQALAAENNLAETAFLVPDGRDYQVRWWTPTVEEPLCGHATLASAAVVMERLEPGRTDVVFASCSGPLGVRRTATGYCLNFPARVSGRVTSPAGLAEALGVVPVEVFGDQYNYMAVVETPAIVRDLTPDLQAIARIGRSGVVVTAPGEDGYDFVSRYFAPAKGVPEDPATGSAHCMLAPYWGARLRKTSFRAAQLSARGGEIVCRLAGDRVELEGGCVFYLEGRAEV